MKKIKFRGYNRRTEEFTFIDDLYWFEENGVHENGDNDWIIDAYTGWKDKFGVDIYENTIISASKKGSRKDEAKEFGAVKWNDRKSCFIIEGIKSYKFGVARFSSLYDIVACGTCYTHLSPPEWAA